MTNFKSRPDGAVELEPRRRTGVAPVSNFGLLAFGLPCLARDEVPPMTGEIIKDGDRRDACPTRRASRVTRRAFSMVELLVVMTLLSLIVLALMAVFNSTQAAFRASVTQTDVLEGSRVAVDLITTDLRTITPSDGNYVSTGNFYSGTVLSSNAVNFLSLDNSYAYSSWSGGTLLYQPLPQSMPGSTLLRTNVLNYFFILGRENTKWTGVGYVVNATNTSPLYPLYRFYEEANIATPPYLLYSNFVTAVNQSRWTNMSHVLDGVVHLTVRAFDPNGYWMTNTYQFHSTQWVTNKNVWFMFPISGEVGCYFYSNMVPAAVELQLGVLEDRALQRAESLPFQSPAQINYLSQQSGKVHLFRQRVNIPNVDPTAYQ